MYQMYFPHLVTPSPIPFSLSYEKRGISRGCLRLRGRGLFSAEDRFRLFKEQDSTQGALTQLNGFPSGFPDASRHQDLDKDSLTRPRAILVSPTV